jgi:ATP-binding cassette subfamily F protein uup
VREYVGGYSDWLRQGKTLAEVDDPNIDSGVESTPAESQAKQKTKKLSYNEQRELDQLPQQIEILETKVDSLLKKISASDFYSQDHDETGPVLQEFTKSQQALDLALERWTELEDQQQRYQESRT